MAERTVAVKVDAKVTGAVAGLRKVKASIDDLTKADIKKPQKAFDDLATKGALMGGVVALGIGKAISSFADFDQQMSAVSAALPQAGAQMDSLRKLAIDLGKDTQFSATEAAAGVTEMAKAGVEAGDILNGGLKGGLDLAAAGQLDVARASEIAATALNQFNLKGSDVPHVADLYAAAAGKAQGSVEDIAQAMKYAGVTASSMGIGIEETTGVIGLFASKGIIGEQAGTSFRSMLLSLTSPSQQAAGVMEELGINVYDASGKFIGMQGVADQLQTKLGGLDEATRNQALGQIFGNESMSAAVALYQGGGKAVGDWTAKVNDAGFAQEQAAKLTDNLKGDIERLSGSIETNFIQAGSGANDMLRNLVQGAGKFVDMVGNIPGPVLIAGGAIGGLLLGLPKVLTGFRQWKEDLDTLGLSVDKLSEKFPEVAASVNEALGGAEDDAGSLGEAMGAVGKGVGIAAAAIGIINGTLEVFGYGVESIDLKSFVRDLTNANGSIAELDKTLTKVALGDKFAEGSDGIETFDQALLATFDPSALDKVNQWADSFNGIFGVDAMSGPNVAAKRFDEIDQALSKMVSSGNADAAAQLYGEMAKKAAAQGISVEQLNTMLPQYTDATSAAGAAAKGAASDIGGMSDNVKTVEKNADDAKKALDDLTSTIEGFGSPLASQRAAQRDFADSVRAGKDALKSQREDLIKQRTDELLGGKSKTANAALDSANLRVKQAQAKVNESASKNQGGKGKASTSTLQALERATLAQSQAQDKANTAQGKAKDLTAAQRKEIEKWADAQIKQTNLLDINTEAGSKNQAILDAMRDSTLKSATATFKLTGSQKLTADEVKKGRQAFIDQAKAFGLSADKAGELADNMGLVPKEVSSAISLSGVPTANAQLDTVTGKVTILDKKTAKPQIKPFINTANADAVDARIDQIARQRSAFISISAGLTGAASGLLSGIGGIGKLAFTKKATGGPIKGPGTGTSDTAGLFALSNDEHVLTAAEVRAAGGHAAIYALRKAILTGGVQYRASGGPASTRAYRAAPVMGRSGSSIDYDRLGAAVAAQMPPMVSVHSGADARSAARTAIRDWEWSQTQ